jgi:hypothetical protein
MLIDLAHKKIPQRFDITSKLRAPLFGDISRNFLIYFRETVDSL